MADRKHQVEQKPATHHEGPPPMMSRKLRHAKQKSFSYLGYLKLGIVVFGTLFAGLVVFELMRASTTVQPDQADKPAMEDRQVAPPAPAVKESPALAETPVAAVDEMTASKDEKTGTSAPLAASPGPSNLSTPSTSAPASSAAKTAEETTALAQEAESAGKKAEAVKSAQPPAAKPKVIRYVVQPGDTLFKLSRRYYGNGRGVDNIARYNGIDPNGQLPAGKVLMIPLP